MYSKGFVAASNSGFSMRRNSVGLIQMERPFEVDKKAKINNTLSQNVRHYEYKPNRKNDLPKKASSKSRYFSDINFCPGASNGSKCPRQQGRAASRHPCGVPTYAGGGLGS